MNQNYKGHYMVNIVHYMFDPAPAQAAMLQHYGAEAFHEVPWETGWDSGSWFELTMQHEADPSPKVTEVKSAGPSFLFQPFLQRRMTLNKMMYHQQLFTLE